MLLIAWESEMKSYCLAGLSVAMLLSGSACSTTSTKILVQRAPKIAFKGLRTVSMSVTSDCTDVLRGPEKAPRQEANRPLISISFGDNAPLVERRTPCADPAFTEQVQTAILGMLRERLTAQKYTVVPADNTGEPGLRVQLKLARFRQAKGLDERKDQAGDQTCQRTCGMPVCKMFHFVGQLQLEATFLGPNLPGAGVQQETLSEAFYAIRLHPATLAQGGVVKQNWGSFSGTDAVLTCTEDGARTYVQNEAHFHWDEGRRLMAIWLDKQFEPMFSTHDEEFKLALFNVKGSSDNELGLKAAKENNFYEAFQSFQAALKNAPQNSTNEHRARLLYNAAAAKMQLGDLRAAQDLISQSMITTSTSKSLALQQEIMRRIVDEAKM